MTMPHASIQWSKLSRVNSSPECRPRPVVKAAPTLPGQNPLLPQVPLVVQPPLEMAREAAPVGGAQYQGVGRQQVLPAGFLDVLFQGSGSPDPGHPFSYRLRQGTDDGPVAVIQYQYGAATSRQWHRTRSPAWPRQLGRRGPSRQAPPEPTVTVPPHRLVDIAEVGEGALLCESKAEGIADPHESAIPYAGLVVRGTGSRGMPYADYLPLNRVPDLYGDVRRLEGEAAGDLHPVVGSRGEEAAPGWQ